MPLVLCYHAVSRTWDHRLSMTPELLLRQVRTLSRVRGVRVTFDDAYASAATVFADLRLMGAPVTVYVCTAFARAGSPVQIAELAGDDPEELSTMDWDELRGHCENGIEVGSHGVSHAHLTELADDELRCELVDSKEEIEAELGRPLHRARVSLRRARPPCESRRRSRRIRAGICLVGRRARRSVRRTAARPLPPPHSLAGAAHDHGPPPLRRLSAPPPRLYA